MPGRFYRSIRILICRDFDQSLQFADVGTEHDLRLWIVGTLPAVGSLVEPLPQCLPVASHGLILYRWGRVGVARFDRGKLLLQVADERLQPLGRQGIVKRRRQPARLCKPSI